MAASLRSETDEATASRTKSRSIARSRATLVSIATRTGRLGGLAISYFQRAIEKALPFSGRKLVHPWSVLFDDDRASSLFLALCLSGFHLLSCRILRRDCQEAARTLRSLITAGGRCGRSVGLRWRWWCRWLRRCRNRQGRCRGEASTRGRRGHFCTRFGTFCRTVRSR